MVEPTPGQTIARLRGGPFHDESFPVSELAYPVVRVPEAVEFSTSLEEPSAPGVRVHTYRAERRFPYLDGYWAIYHWESCSPGI